MSHSMRPSPVGRAVIIVDYDFEIFDRPGERLNSVSWDIRRRRVDQHAFGPRLAGAGREEKSVDGVWEKVVSSSESGFYKTSVFEATVWARTNLT